MAARGQHAKTNYSTADATINDYQRERYEPTFVVPSTHQRQAPRIVLIVALVALLAIVPLSLGRIASSMNSEAYADSARSAFPVLADTGVEQPAASFGLLFDVLVDEEQDYVPEAPLRFTDNVSAELQRSVMEGGCELVALDIVLDSMGLDADVHDIADNHLVIDGHFATGYSGNPYVRGGGYPAGIVNAANSYLSAKGATVRARDLTGYTFDELKELVEKGYPVLVWTTMGLSDPEYAAAFDNGMEWYSNEHCVVLYGFGDGTAKVSDPLEGLVERDLARFQSVYEKCGSMAAVIY